MLKYVFLLTTAHNARSVCDFALCGTSFLTSAYCGNKLMGISQPPHTIVYQTPRNMRLAVRFSQRGGVSRRKPCILCQLRASRLSLAVFLWHIRVVKGNVATRRKTRRRRNRRTIRSQSSYRSLRATKSTFRAHFPPVYLVELRRSTSATCTHVKKNKAFNTCPQLKARNVPPRTKL